MAVKTKIRLANKADIPFITSTWLNNYKWSHFGKYISRRIYFKEHHRLIQRTIQATPTYVSCDPEDEGFIYGYIVGDNFDGYDLVHYIFVKGPFRNFGIGKALFEHLNKNKRISITHQFDFKKDVPDKIFVYNPYLFLIEIHKEDL